MTVAAHLVRLAGALMCVAFVATGKSAELDAVDRYMQSELAARKIPGAALVVIRRGETIKMQGYGLANVELEVPVTADTVFELASVTKQFTAAAIMLLVEEGKLRLDAPINEILPGGPKSWSGITVHHLLTHTGGLASLEEGFRSLAAGGWRLQYTTKQMFESAAKDPLSFAPGERYQYSDVGYFLLGMVVEKVSGRRYAEFLSERFFRPLGMTSSSVIDQWAIVRNRADGYTLRAGQLVHIRRHVQIELPSHYGVLTSVRDLVRWDAALAAGKVVKPSSLELMWTPVRLNDGSTYPYGYGWAVDERRGHRRISHTGITGTEYSRYPDDSLVVIVLTNLGAHVGATGINSWGLTHGVAGRYIDGLLVSMIPEEPDQDPELSQKLREMLVSIGQGADPPMAGAKLRSLIRPLTQKIVAERMATLKSFTFISCDDVGTKVMEHFGERIERVCYYKMVTAPETRYYTFRLTKDARVADFNSALE